MNWQNIIPVLLGGVLGFILKVLHGKIFEKKVNLFFELDKPAVFSAIPPMICFQNLKIWNKGNLPAQKVRINLDDDLLKSYKVVYKPNTEEKFEEEINEKVLTIKFEKLLPSEELTISFKCERRIPSNFLLSIKSDEMLELV